ncbi:hypothetical protein NI18_13115, partial [Sphingomonas sp. Ant20]
MFGAFLPPATRQHRGIDRRRRARQRIDIRERPAPTPTASTLMLRPDRSAATIARSLGASLAHASSPFAASANRRSPTVSVTPAERSRSRLRR